MKRYVVSILINNYNYGRFLKRAVDSALEQTYSPVEVVVVDDGSTDSSRKIIAQYGSQIISVLKENGGQASAFNAGFAASCGEIICFLDADDFYLEEKVSQIVKIYHTYPDIGWCFHTLQLIDLHTNTLLGKSREKHSRQCDFRGNARRGKIKFYAPATTGLTMKRSLLEQILPMVESEGTRICADRFVATAALAIASGFYLDRAISYQGIHGNNGFNFNPKINQKKSRSKLVTAHALRTKFPELERYSNREFASGLCEIWKSDKIEVEYRQLIQDYWLTVSPIEKLKMALWIAYRSLPRQQTSCHRID